MSTDPVDTNTNIKLNLQNQGDKDADLKNYTIAFDAYAVNDRYLSSTTAESIVGDSMVSAGRLINITFTTSQFDPEDMERVEARIMCSDTGDAVYCE